MFSFYFSLVGTISPTDSPSESEPLDPACTLSLEKSTLYFHIELSRLTAYE